jgi:ABC-2 type transport system ATP-binding protein
VIHIRDLSFQYGKTSIYDNFNLTIDQPGIHGLFGTNGTGKSTLLKLINGLLFPNQGSCTVMNEVSSKRSPDLLEKIYYLPEEIDSPAVTALAFGELKGAFYPQFDNKKLYELLKLFSIPEDKLMHQMSYGQRKKAMIAIAMASNAPLLLMDEPTNGLDIPSKLRFREAVNGFFHSKDILIISTHQVRDLDEIMNHLLILQEGQILFQDSIARIEQTFECYSNSSLEKDDQSLFQLKNGDVVHHIRRNLSGRPSPVHLETLISAFFEQPQAMKENI